MSGVKGRSDRKPDLAVQTCRTGIAKAVSATQSRKIWRALAAAAEQGNVQAARLLHEYRYGSPQPEPMPPPPVPTVASHFYWSSVDPDSPQPAGPPTLAAPTNPPQPAATDPEDDGSLETELGHAD